VVTHGRFSRIRQVAPMCTPYTESQKMVDTATSLSIAGPHVTRSTPMRVHDPNCISMGSAVFAQTTADCPYTLQWDALSPQNCPFLWGIWTAILYMVPWVHPSPQPKDISIGAAVFAGLTSVTDRQTDRPTDRQTQSDRPRYSASNNRPHLRM